MWLKKIMNTVILKVCIEYILTQDSDLSQDRFTDFNLVAEWYSFIIMLNNYFIKKKKWNSYNLEGKYQFVQI